MDGRVLREARQTMNWTQRNTAEALGVTQAYLSMLETGSRSVSKRLGRKALKALNLPPTALPLQLRSHVAASVGKHDFGVDLAALGYPGFAYLKTRTRRNPAVVLLESLDEADLDSRVAEGLPWLALTYVDMDWDWLVRNAKLQDRQNRLGFAVSLATQLAEGKGESDKAQKLRRCLEQLERARLAREDTFCHDSMTEAERVWLRNHRSPVAGHWSLLTDMESKNLGYAS
jgi:transcriptional regulator with XRE-family HTH domain